MNKIVKFINMYFQRSSNLNEIKKNEIKSCSKTSIKDL